MLTYRPGKNGADCLLYAEAAAQVAIAPGRGASRKKVWLVYGGDPLFPLPAAFTLTERRGPIVNYSYAMNGSMSPGFGRVPKGPLPADIPGVIVDYTTTPVEATLYEQPTADLLS